MESAVRFRDDTPGVVLRAMLFAVDRHRAREVTGIDLGHLPASRGRT